MEQSDSNIKNLTFNIKNSIVPNIKNFAGKMNYALAHILNHIDVVAYILSGALTPSRPRPFEITIFIALTRNNLA